jgi:hypothetical protein
VPNSVQPVGQFGVLGSAPGPYIQNVTVPPAELPEVPLNAALSGTFESVLPVFGALIVIVGVRSPTVVSATPHTLLDPWLLVSPLYVAYHQ